MLSMREGTLEVLVEGGRCKARESVLSLQRELEEVHNDGGVGHVGGQAA